MIEVTRVGRVRKITINRPEKRNALNLEMCRQLIAVIEASDAGTDTGAIVLNGEGPAFCAGMDLKEALHTDSPELARTHERLFTTINRIRKPIIAAVHGPALAAGTGLAANAHIVIAAPDAVFGLTEINVGLWPMVVFRSVALAIGERRATEMSITGRHVGADEAYAFGLVTEIATDTLGRAMEIADKVAAFSSFAMHEGLAYIHRNRLASWEDAGRNAQEVRDSLMAGKDFTSRVNSFLNRPK